MVPIYRSCGLIPILTYLRDIVSKVMDDGGVEEELKQKIRLTFFKKKPKKVSKLVSKEIFR